MINTQTSPELKGCVVLSVQGVGKSYDSFQALQDLSLELHAGEITAVIGPNGAGK